MRDTSDLTGRTFGNWQVVKLLRTGFYECQCSCGNLKPVRRTSLTGGVSTSCGCQRNKLLREAQFEGCGDISLSYWNRLRSNAKRRGIEVALSIQQAWDKFVRQEKRCALSGLSIGFETRHRDGEGTASLDRIDNTQGYTLSNVQWVHRVVNKMKMELDQTEFLFWVTQIGLHQKILDGKLSAA